MIVYGLFLRGESACFSSFHKSYSKKLFYTKEKALEYRDEFVEKCCDFIMITNQIKSIKINFQEWSQYLKNKAQRSLLDKEIKTFEGENFEPAENLALKYKLKREENLQIPIIDQKNETVGKISVYYMPEKTISAFWCKRIT